MPHGQNDKDSIQWDNGACRRLIGDHTYECMWTHERPTRNGLRYFVTFTDDLSRYGYIYLMKHKSETFERFKEFHSEVENQLGKKIKHLRSDRGGEYLSHEFGNHLMSCGIVPQLTLASTPQSN